MTVTHLYHSNLEMINFKTTLFFFFCVMFKFHIEFWEATFFRFNHFNPTVSDESCRELWLRSWIFTGRSHLSWCMGSGHILIYLCNIFPDKGSTTYKKQSHCRKLRGEQRDHKNDNAFFSNIWQQQQLANAPKARTTIFCIFWPWTCWCSRYHAVIYKWSTHALLTNASVVGSCLGLNGKKWIPEILHHLAKTTLTTAKFQPLSLSIVGNSG